MNIPAADTLTALPAALASRYLGDFMYSYRYLYPQADEARINRLLARVAAMQASRPAALVRLDMERSTDPAWFQAPHHVGMMLYVDLFAGDLSGLMDHIGYFKELGITYLHLMPLLRPRTGPNDGGYAVASYREVNPRLGTLDDLRQLATRLHEEGILLVIDLVMNHTAREHEWAAQALAGDPHYQAFYLMFDDRSLPDQFERTLPEVFPDFAPGNFTWQPEIRKWVWTTFYDFQWDLNYRNPDVFEAMLEEIFFLINIGVDILRLDAVPFLWKNMGTTCQNQPEVVHLLTAFRALVKLAAPGVLFKSEAIVSPEDIIKYLGSGGFEGKACEIGYNATLMNHLWQALAAENTHLLRTTLRNLPPLPREATWINYIRCHDDIGWGISDANAAAVGQGGRDTRNFCTDFYAGAIPGSYAEGYVFQRDRVSGEARISGTAAALAGLQKAQFEADPDLISLAVRRLTVLNGVIFFMRGIPLIYAGDEVGQLNDTSYLLDSEKAFDNRWLHRPPMSWTKAARREVPGSVEQQLFDMHRRYIHARQGATALHGQSEDRLVIPDNHHLFVCERMYGGARMMLIANLSRNLQRVSLTYLPYEWRSGVYRDVLTGHQVRATDGGVVVPGYGVYWLESLPADEAPVYEEITLRMHVMTTYGETVFLTGSLPELGAWAPARAVECRTDTQYPWWVARVRVPVGQPFAWKWIRVRDGYITQWAPDNQVHIPGFM